MKSKNNGFSCALVTGATSGIGKALALLLAKKGINLILTGRNQKELDIVAEVCKQHVDVLAIQADLLNAQEKAKVIEAILRNCPDLVINNAGFGLYGDALSQDASDELNVLQINGNVVLELTLEAAKALKSNQQTGTIINVASVAAFFVFPSSAVYSAAKRFVVQLSLSLDQELQSHGIRVLAACPGMVETAFSERAANKPQQKQPLSMNPEEAAEHIWWQIEKGKNCYIFNWKYRWLQRLSSLLPTTLVAEYLKRNINERL